MPVNNVGIHLTILAVFYSTTGLNSGQRVAPVNLRVKSRANACASISPGLIIQGNVYTSAL